MNDQVSENLKNLGPAALVLFWSLLPTPAIWIGLNVFHSAIWAYILYHGIILLPIIWGRKLWQSSIKKPSAKQLQVLLISSILFSIVGVFGYEHFGHYIFSSVKALEVLTEQGWKGRLFWPISLYAVFVNPWVEELFWRGVVFNQLARTFPKPSIFALVWSSVFYAALHYPITRLVVGPGIGFGCTFSLFLYGIIMAILYRSTKSIVLTALAHGFLTDLAAIVIYLRMDIHA